MHAVLACRPGFSLDRVDRELRTDGFAKVAVYAPLLVYHLGIMIALDVEVRAEVQDPAGAVLDAELAALAPVFDYYYFSTCDPDRLQVQRCPPKVHGNPPKDKSEAKKLD